MFSCIDDTLLLTWSEYPNHTSVRKIRDFTKSHKVTNTEIILYLNCKFNPTPLLFSSSRESTRDLLSTFNP